MTDKINRNDTSPRSRKWLFAISLLSAIAGWMAWPYYAVYDLAVAFRDGDAATLETRVAWESVRQGIRGDLTAVLPRLFKPSDGSLGEVLGSGLIVALGPMFIDRILDNYLTPQTIAAAMRAHKAEFVAEGNAVAPKNFGEKVLAAANVRVGQIKHAFFSGSPLRFPL